ncbi:MAG: heavy metal translocating P-type ATPase [Oscillospiraceae bacterium]
MKYSIVSDLPGRIRVRCGKNVLSAEQAQAITTTVGALPYVQKVQASAYSGGILVTYTAPNRSLLLEALKEIKLTQLQLPQQDALVPQNMQIDNSFFQQLFVLVRNHFLRRWFVPAPLRNLYVIYRAAQYALRAVRCLRQGKMGVDVLDGAAVAVSALQGNFSTASSIMLLLKMSDLLEEYTHEKAKTALTQSLVIQVDQVWVKKGDEEIPLPLSRIVPGDKVIVRTGSLIPVDGTICEGEAMVNKSSMTGEPLAVFKQPGGGVFAGTVVEDGQIIVEARTVNANSRINQIAGMINESEALKASVQGKAERIADGLVPFSFGLAAAVFIFTGNLRKALSVLLVDYSCAIKLTTPISIISAMKEAANHGIVVKGGKYLEAMAEADTIVFDKTGTLTVANPTVSKVVPFAKYTREEVLRTAACLEEHFPHSVARAVVNKAKEENLRHEEEHTDVEYITAHGIVTAFKDKRAVIGSAHFVFEDEKVPLTKAQEALIEKEAGDDSVIFLAIGDKPAGFVCIQDPPRPESAEVIAALKQTGIKQVVMLTGDSDYAAKIVAQQLGIDWYRAQVLPEDKVAIIQDLNAKGHKVIMVGDGINDSPALAAADVSVSMRSASDIAREVADMTLLTDDLHALVTIRRLSVQTMRHINHNFASIIALNTAWLLLGIGNIITPSAAALLHNLTTLAMSAQSMRPRLTSASFAPLPQTPLALPAAD